MEHLETILQTSIKGSKNKLSKEDIYKYSVDDSNMFVSALFHSVTEIIEDYSKTGNLYNAEYMFEYLDILKEQNKEIDILSLKKKITKLEKRIEYIKTNNLKNKKRLKKEIDNFQEELVIYKNNLEIKEENAETNFINYLIEKPREIHYIDMVFDKMPEVMKIKDNAGLSLYRNVINKYIISLHDNDKENTEYYKKLLLMLNAKKKIEIKEKDKKIILKDILDELNNLTRNSKEKKQNKDKIEQLIELKNIVTANLEEINELDEIASKYKIEINFSNKIIDLVENNNLVLNKEKDNTRKRIKEYIVSIDGENSVEIDDALSCRKLDNGNYLLGVHIASILGYFDYDSEVVQNAFDRVRSIYLHTKLENNEGMIPIFPLEFAAGYASLKEGEDRLTRSYFFEIDKKGNIVNQEFIKSIINNNKRATYDEINKILDNGSDDLELLETVNNLKEVTKLLSKKYSSNEIYELIKENGSNTSNLRVKRYASEQIVYQAMLLTGNKVAEYFANNNYPCLYRVHSVSKKVENTISHLVNELVDTYGGEQKNTLYNLLNGIYPKSTYDVSGRHDGLNLDHYCHCTSGLRRSADIVVEHALEVCHDKKPTSEELKELYYEILDKKEKIVKKESSLNWFVEDFHKTYYKKKTN